MVLSGFLVRLSGMATTALAVAITVVCHVMLPDASQAFASESAIARLLLIAGQEGFLLVNYPVLPWLAVCLFGVAYGHALNANAGRALRAALPMGAVLLLSFIAIRTVGSFGTHHPMADEGWMALLTVTKYPPSIAFVLLSLGTNALFLSLITGADRHLDGVARPLLVFGRSPLFFYVAHMYLYAIVGVVMPGETSLLGMYPVWIAGLVALYPACLWYDGFKRGKSEESLWRLF